MKFITFLIVSAFLCNIYNCHADSPTLKVFEMIEKMESEQRKKIYSKDVTQGTKRSNFFSRLSVRTPPDKPFKPDRLRPENQDFTFDNPGLPQSKKTVPQFNTNPIEEFSKKMNSRFSPTNEMPVRPYKPVHLRPKIGSTFNNPGLIQPEKTVPLFDIHRIEQFNKSWNSGSNKNHHIVQQTLRAIEEILGGDQLNPTLDSMIDRIIRPLYEQIFPIEIDSNSAIVDCTNNLKRVIPQISLERSGNIGDIESVKKLFEVQATSVKELLLKLCSKSSAEKLTPRQINRWNFKSTLITKDLYSSDQETKCSENINKYHEGFMDVHSKKFVEDLSSAIVPPLVKEPLFDRAMVKLLESFK
ncbi:hypothetical protein OAB57_00010 [Bacteriovoracaceae bacterium]|nr:hypothetical protein [Bacteriovoracaceae bacterium]